mgnify:CR=1 FL=1
MTLEGSNNTELQKNGNGVDNQSSSKRSMLSRICMPLIGIALIAMSRITMDMVTVKGLPPDTKESSRESESLTNETLAPKGNLSLANNYSDLASVANLTQERKQSSDSLTVEPSTGNYGTNFSNNKFTDLPLEVINSEVIINGHSFSHEDPDLLPYLPLPKPILVVGMPKAGTTSIHSFFQAAGYRSAHYRCKEDQGILDLFCGHCIRDAIQNNLPPLKTCGDYDVWAQMDVTYYPANNIERCYYPQFLAMEKLHKEAPNATIIFNRRDLDHWAKSVQRWTKLSLAYRLTKCKEGPASQSVKDLKKWHKNHIQAIRGFVNKHPSHALVEIDIEDDITGKRMATLFQVEEKFWKRRNANKKNT